LAINSTFGFEKIFVVDHTMATGVLFVLVDGQKPLKNSKENNYTFVVLEGAVQIQLHKTDFVIAPHGMFFVPRGNDYSIKNISKRTAKIAFTQCRGS
jgi:centromere protein C